MPWFKLRDLKRVSCLILIISRRPSPLRSGSPDLNFIEPEITSHRPPKDECNEAKEWSKIKALLRSAEACTPTDLDEAISHAFSKITAKDAGLLRLLWV